MKKILLALTIIFAYSNSYSQCTPDPQYQDSSYAIWPDTIQNLPTVTQGQSYFTTLTVKTPGTLLEANAGDSSILYIDTLGTSTFVGGWPVDSMELVQVNGLPTGLNLQCESLLNMSNCMLPGDYLTCAYVDGTTNDPIGIYPIELLVNVYTHGTIVIFPISTDLYSALGSYESITGYNIVVSNTSSYEMFNSNEFSLLQNIPNPSDGNTKIMFNTPNAENVILKVVDMFGKCVVSKEISSVSGLNTINLSKDLSSGIYNYSVQVNDVILTKRMIITK
ncbi:MAG: T9SS type A sorting domain-containing protein [Flavobacteriales bacterium]|nr:T9SS type A sorting domain-containing protein [Flavobacteriales bacterium]